MIPKPQKIQSTSNYRLKALQIVSKATDKEKKSSSFLIEWERNHSNYIEWHEINSFSGLILYWLTDFKCMSTRLELFYAKGLGNRVNCAFIFTFFV